MSNTYILQIMVVKPDGSVVRENSCQIESDSHLSSRECAKEFLKKKGMNVRKVSLTANGGLVAYVYG